MLNYLLVSDRKYYPYLIVLLRSMSQHQTPPYRVYVHLINCQEIYHTLYPLALLNPHVIISFHEKELPDKLLQQKLHMTGMTEKMAYCANIRVTFMRQILIERKLPNIIYMDVDSIVRKDLFKLERKIHNKDILFYSIHDEDKLISKTKDILLNLENHDSSQPIPIERNIMFLKSGIVAFQNTPTSCLFITKWEQVMHRYGIYRWFSDQRSLLVTFLLFHSKIRYGLLSFSYIDWEYSLISRIWMGKGKNKKKNHKYLELTEHYWNQIWWKKPKIEDTPKKHDEINMDHVLKKLLEDVQKL